MSRSVLFASACDSTSRTGRRIGVALALAAMLGQLLIAAHGEAAHGTATHAASGLEYAAGTLSAAGAAHAALHDSADCPTCRAAAHGRTAVPSALVGRAAASPPRLELVCFNFDDLPGQLTRSTVTPRAPPA
jgi:hypothetical protein